MSDRQGVVVVTGASGGVGRATVRTFAARGYDVAVLARGRAGLEAAAAEVKAAGRAALVVPTDVAEWDQVRGAAGRVERELGPIDIWVNNAMTTAFQVVADTAPEDFERAIRVTFLGQVWGTKAALEHMRPRDRGAIVNVGSALAFVGIPLQAAYCSAKFACRGFFESMRAELINEGSHVTIGMVHLPAVNTPQFSWCQTNVDRQPMPVPPIYQPELAADRIVRSALDGRRERAVGVWNRFVIGVGSVVPGFTNHFAALTGVDSQLTDQPIGPDRPANLRVPADEDRDWGAHGIFDDRAAGMLDPSFLKGAPQTLAQLGRAAGAELWEQAVTRWRAWRIPTPHN